MDDQNIRAWWSSEWIRANHARTHLHKSGMTLLSSWWSFKSKSERWRATLMEFKINAEPSSRHAGWWVSHPCTFHSAEVIKSPRLSTKSCFLEDKIRRSKAVLFHPKTPGSRAEANLQVCRLETSLNLTGNHRLWFHIQTVNKRPGKVHNRTRLDALREILSRDWRACNFCNMGKLSVCEAE